VTAILLLADTVLTLDAQDHIYHPGYLVVENNRIVETGWEDNLAARHFDSQVNLSNRLIMPGLVNAHTHTPMVLFRGMAEPYSLFTFEGWYEGIRRLEAVMSPEMVPPAVAVSCAEMIRTGTTCFADQYFYMDQVIPIVRQSGMRASLAYGIVELGDPQVRRRELGILESFLESLQGDSKIRGWVGPHAFFMDNSLEAIRMELALASRFGAGLHFHFATSGEEDRYCQEKYGRSAIQQMKALGILNYQLLAAHGITIPPEDFADLAGSNLTVVIAPSACMRSGSAIAPLKAMLAAGIHAALGTDNVANNNSYDLFKEMRSAAQLMSSREREPNAIPAREILSMATLGGARGLGLEQEIGSLEAGKKADIISLDLDEIGWTPTGAQDLYTALVHTINGQYVRDVMVDGAWLYREGRWMTLDYARARQELEAANAELRKRLSK